MSRPVESAQKIVIEVSSDSEPNFQSKSRTQSIAKTPSAEGPKKIILEVSSDSEPDFLKKPLSPRHYALPPSESSAVSSGVEDSDLDSSEEPDIFRSRRRSYVEDAEESDEGHVMSNKAKGKLPMGSDIHYEEIEDDYSEDTVDVPVQRVPNRQFVESLLHTGRDSYTLADAYSQAIGSEPFSTNPTNLADELWENDDLDEDQSNIEIPSSPPRHIIHRRRDTGPYQTHSRNLPLVSEQEIQNDEYRRLKTELSLARHNAEGSEARATFAESQLGITQCSLMETRTQNEKLERLITTLRHEVAVLSQLKNMKPTSVTWIKDTWLELKDPAFKKAQDFFKAGDMQKALIHLRTKFSDSGLTAQQRVTQRTLRAVVLREAHQYDKARMDFYDAIQFGDRYGTEDDIKLAFFHLGVNFSRQGSFAEALQCFYKSKDLANYEQLQQYWLPITMDAYRRLPEDRRRPSFDFRDKTRLGHEYRSNAVFAALHDPIDRNKAWREQGEVYRKAAEKRAEEEENEREFRRDVAEFRRERDAHMGNAFEDVDVPPENWVDHPDAEDDDTASVYEGESEDYEEDSDDDLY